MNTDATQMTDATPAAYLPPHLRVAVWAEVALGLALTLGLAFAPELAIDHLSYTYGFAVQVSDEYPIIEARDHLGNKVWRYEQDRVVYGNTVWVDGGTDAGGAYFFTRKPFPPSPP